jgi:hypothetical protein
MYTSNEHHKQAILSVFEHEFVSKYDKGAIEHGGRIWEKPGMLEEAINEAIDLVVYLFTLRDQINALKAKYDLTDVVDKTPID